MCYFICSFEVGVNPEVVFDLKLEAVLKSPGSLGQYANFLQARAQHDTAQHHFLKAIKASPR